jgi:hypothetical protein
VKTIEAHLALAVPTQRDGHEDFRRAMQLQSMIIIGVISLAHALQVGTTRLAPALHAQIASRHSQGARMALLEEQPLASHVFQQSTSLVADAESNDVIAIIAVPLIVGGILVAAIAYGYPILIKKIQGDR